MFVMVDSLSRMPQEGGVSVGLMGEGYLEWAPMLVRTFHMLYDGRFS